MNTVLAASLAMVAWLFGAEVAGAQGITEKVLLDNEWVTISEVVVPPGVAGGAHATPGHEIGYLLDGALTVTTMTEGKTVQKSGEVKWLPADTIHKIENDERRPAKVLVILLKKRS